MSAIGQNQGPIWLNLNQNDFVFNKKEVRKMVAFINHEVEKIQGPKAKSAVGLLFETLKEPIVLKSLEEPKDLKRKREYPENEQIFKENCIDRDPGE